MKIALLTGLLAISSVDAESVATELGGGQSKREEDVALFSPAHRQALEKWFGGESEEWSAELDWPVLSDAKGVDQARAELWAIYREVRRDDVDSNELGPVPPSIEEIMAAAEAGTGGLRPGSLTTGRHQMPFVLIRKETKPVPQSGRALYICMHGGGRNPEVEGPHAWAINSREWQSQAALAAQVYAGEGIFFVPRMADDRLGRWHHALNQDAFDSVIGHGLREWDVDPNRVYLMGISEGCYGTQILGPFMPDRFGGACAMAGGVGKDVPAENLRNLAFCTVVGEKDTTFNRVGLAREYHARMDEAAKTWGGYVNKLDVQAGRGHGVDYRPGPEWMVGNQRSPFPDTIVWTSKLQDHRRRPSFYWLGLEGEKLEGVVELSARIEGNTIRLLAHGAGGGPLKNATVTVLLNDSMLDLGKPVTVLCNAEEREISVPERSVESLARTLAERGDPTYAFPVELRVSF